MRPTILLASAAAIVVAFAGSFGLHRAGDDWLAAAFAMDAIRTGEPFAQIAQPFTHHFSPLWFALEIANYQLAGWQPDALIRLFVIAWVAAGLVAFASLCRTLGLSTHATAFGVAVLALHPIAAVAYYSFDTYSQVAADALVWTITALLIVASVTLNASRLVVIAVILYIPALLLKEQALAAVLNAIVIALWFRRRSIVIAAIAMLLLSVVFALLRWRAGLWFDSEGPFALCLSCIPANAAVLISGALLPVPASHVYLAFRAGAWSSPFFVLGVAALAAAAMLLALGLREWRRAGGVQTALMMALFVGATFPVVLLADIGELYAHALLFWVAILAAMAWEGWSPPRLAGAAVVTVLAAGLLINLADMRGTSRRAAALLAEMQNAVRTIPPGAGLVLRGFDDTSGAADYGLLRIHSPGRLVLYGLALDVAAERPLRRFDSDEEAHAWRQQTGGELYVMSTDGTVVRAMPIGDR